MILRFVICSYFIVACLQLRAKEIDERIKEVFGTHLVELQKNTKHLELLNDILNNRTKVNLEPYRESEKYQKLSEISLFNTYNPDIKVDNAFDINSFNVLKYDLPFFTRIPLKYRIDGTDYILIIIPINYEE